jgi:hypothetical protein
MFTAMLSSSSSSSQNVGDSPASVDSELEKSSSPGQDRNPLASIDYSHALREMEWFTMWKYVRDAPTLNEVKTRLNQVRTLYPTSGSYCDFLWENVGTWAKCAFTWMLTFGLQASSLQEGIHSQWKGTLDNHLIPLIEAPLFFRRAMKNRQLKRDLVHAAPSARIRTSSLQNDARSKGYGQLAG